MKILIITPTIFVENSPFNHLFKDILEEMILENNFVHRFVAVESYDDSSYKMEIKDKNIEYSLFKRKKCDHLNIFSRYLNDMITHFVQSIHILKLKNIDVLFEDVSYSSFFSVYFSKIKKIKIVSMVQDVWPDNAVQSNLIKNNSILYKLFEFPQKYVYRNSNKIICISDDIKKNLISKGVDEKKIEVIYNWNYTDNTVDINWEDNKFVNKFNIEKNFFYVTYAGNIGKMQNVEIIVESAKILRNEKNIKFVIIGEGSNLNEVKEMSSGLDNVIFFPFQPSDVAKDIYSFTDVNVIPLVNGGIKTALPSKTGVILSCGKPTIYTFGNDALFSKKIQEHNAGYVVEPENAQELADKVIDIYLNRKILKNDIYSFYKKYFLKSKNVKKYIQTIKETVENY